MTKYERARVLGTRALQIRFVFNALSFSQHTHTHICIYNIYFEVQLFYFRPLPLSTPSISFYRLFPGGISILISSLIIVIISAISA